MSSVLSSTETNITTAPTPEIKECITKFCELSRDEMLIKEGCATQYNAVRPKANEYKKTLSTFLQQQQKTCVPLKFSVNGEDVQMYLRRNESTTPKPVNEDAFKTVISEIPSLSDLKATFDEMKDSQSQPLSFVDVYTQWVVNQLKTKNVSRRVTFKLTSSKERLPKGSKKSTPSDVTLPPDIFKMAQELYQIQCNKFRLDTYREEKIEKIVESKKQLEPLLDKFLLSKPKPEQKVAIDVQGKVKPFFIQRTVAPSRPQTLTLQKSQPLIRTSVLKSIDPSLGSATFSERAYNAVFSGDMFTHVLLNNFKAYYDKFRTQTKHPTSTIKLKADQTRTHSNKHSTSQKRQRQSDEESDKSGDDKNSDNRSGDESE